MKRIFNFIATLMSKKNELRRPYIGPSSSGKTAKHVFDLEKSVGQERCYGDS